MLQNYTHFTNQLLQKSFHILCLGLSFPVPMAFLEIYVAVVCMLRDCDAMYSVTQSLDCGSCLQGVYSEYHVIT